MKNWAVMLFGVLWMATGSIIWGGCGDEKDAEDENEDPVYDTTEIVLSGFTGVDLLVVVDNSLSMDAEQQILSTGIYTLINSLVNPIVGDDWPFPEVENVRVAVVTSNMGLQYGDDGSDQGFPYGLKVWGCTDQEPKGDDGRFMGYKTTTINPESGKISCEDGGGQCPADWNCNDKSKCIAPDATTTNCPDLPGSSNWAQTDEEQKNAKLATQVACLAQQGTGGCGIEQQLEAPVRALSRTNQREFLKDSHLLAILIVSDEEDCSVQNEGLFQTKEFKSGAGSDGLLNVGCNLPESNETSFLFDTNRYWEKFVALKDNQARAVIFAAIVGVPTGEKCEGTGDNLGDCLDVPEMQLKIQDFDDGTNMFKHFAPACDRDDDDGVEVTSARPGRRYVKVAQKFGPSGYVYSICNADWSPAMAKIAAILGQNLVTVCYPKPLEWNPESGTANCEVIVELRQEPSMTECPASLTTAPGYNSEFETIEMTLDSNGEVLQVVAHCPLPKLPTSSVDCDSVEQELKDSNVPGWFYCEDKNEDFSDNCDDGLDNDEDARVDCEDEGCQDCDVCAGSGIGCRNSCKFSVRLSDQARDIALGSRVYVACPQHETSTCTGSDCTESV
jgi:hypothetical protein